MANIDFNMYLQQTQRLWDENKDWLMMPLLINGCLLLVGIVLVFLLGSETTWIFKTIVIILFLAMPFAGFYSGPYLDEMWQKIEPSFEEMTSKFSKK